MPPRPPALMPLLPLQALTALGLGAIRETSSMELPPTTQVVLYSHPRPMAGERAPVRTVEMGAHPRAGPQVVAVMVCRSTSRDRPSGMAVAVAPDPTVGAAALAWVPAAREGAVPAAREEAAAAVSLPSATAEAQPFRTPVVAAVGAVADRAAVTDMVAAAVPGLSSSATHSDNPVLCFWGNPRRDLHVFTFPGRQAMIRSMCPSAPTSLKWRAS